MQLQIVYVRKSYMLKKIHTIIVIIMNGVFCVHQPGFLILSHIYTY